MTNTELLMSTMALAGDKFFIKTLADLLHVTRTTAAKKLKGQALFDQEEIAILAEHYRLTAEDIKSIFLGID